jgi:DNA-binding response OmpR family regulator
MEKKRRILVADDEKEIADLIEIHLVNEGYEVLKAADGNAALDLLDKRDFQLVILDIMMPGIDGIEVCRRIRKSGNIPILMLSAKSRNMDKVLGLSSGADDYLAKPFDILELLARVKSLLRRFLDLNAAAAASDSGAFPAPRQDILQVRGLVIDSGRRTVTLDGRDVRLTPTEFNILSLLAGRPGRVFRAEDIFRAVWRDRYYDSNNTVMVHIRKIREKIEDDPGRPRFVKTVWGVGYKIED